jgi:hypothetical protein
MSKRARRRALIPGGVKPAVPGEEAWMATEPERLLEIYLADHLAASLAGVELARRIARKNPELDGVRAEIEEDRETLRRVVARLGFSESRPKEALAWAGEKVGRLKLNGRLVRSSPLSGVLELEALSVGIAGKLALWETLQRVPDPRRRFRASELRHLIERARRQREEVEELRLEAVHQAFAGGVGGARSEATH